MDDFLALLILTYFRDAGSNYSYTELHDKIGVPLDTLETLIEDLLAEGMLQYSTSGLLSVSYQGGERIRGSEMSTYHYLPVEKAKAPWTGEWPIDRPYPIHRFSHKKWRGGKN